MERTYTTEQIAQNWVVWLDALASGQYKKTKQYLHDMICGEEHHCCLGVAQICLGLDKTYDGTDPRLVGILGFTNDVGTLNNGNNSITDLNDHKYGRDIDFVNMHRELLANIEGITHLHPDVAPLVRKMLAERKV